VFLKIQSFLLLFSKKKRFLSDRRARLPNMPFHPNTADHHFIGTV
jgi:hypothetical protein